MVLFLSTCDVIQTDCRSALSDARQAVARLEEERKETADRLRAQTNRANEIDEEVIQARTENDVLTIQLAEYTSTMDSYRVG
jgi:phage shock protein A